MARISSIDFDRTEQPLRTTICTRLGTVKVRWMEVCGDKGWQKRHSRRQKAGRASH